MEEGTIKFYNTNKNYGFITKTNNTDIFYHKSDINNLETLKEGDKVQFEIGKGKKGEKAINIQKVQ